MRFRSLSALLVFAGLVGLGCNNNKLVDQPAQPTPPPTHSLSDTFSQTAANGKSDILFVINNTDDTMVAKATTLGNSSAAFMSFLLTNNIDFHIAVTSMDMNTITLTPDAPGCTQAIG